MDQKRLRIEYHTWLCDMILANICGDLRVKIIIDVLVGLTHMPIFFDHAHHSYHYPSTYYYDT